ncbi:MAG: hypothetical protein Kow0047_06440 [Anaerolineae bacterium]
MGLRICLHRRASTRIRQAHAAAFVKLMPRLSAPSVAMPPEQSRRGLRIRLHRRASTRIRQAHAAAFVKLMPRLSAPAGHQDEAVQLRGIGMGLRIVEKATDTVSRPLLERASLAVTVGCGILRVTSV